MMDPGADDLQPSLLGTQEYWDETYTTEMENFVDHGDVGEIWFGEDSSQRVVRWLSSCELVNKDDSVIDLGCGNGMQLIELAEEGFTNLTGIDYSETAIDLAKAVAEKHQASTICFKVFDILADDTQSSETSIQDNQFAVALDKGTYDAISLNPNDALGKRTKYIGRVWHLLRTKGLLVITSCNWTEDELLAHFGKRFKLFSTIPTPKFEFGGKTGSCITTVIFMKE